MKKQKKGFTLIELLVTIAILAILVLIGAPRLVGYLEKAELVRIQHDVKVMEQEMTTTMLHEEINGWQNNQKSLGSLIMKRQLYEKEGFAEKIDKRHLFINGLNYQLAYHSLNNDELSDNLGLGGDLIPINSEELGVGGNLVTEEEFSVDKTYKVIPEEYSKKINTKLPGTFYTNSIGKVYYEHDKPLNIDDEKEELTCPSPLPDYDFQLINGKGTIVKWHGTALHLVIPPYFLLEVDGEEQCVPVQVIGTGAFQNGGFKSIDIPSTVEKIEDDAFADNDLGNVDIPPSVDNIGNGAFENNDIDKIEIPHSVDSIGDNAFAGNDNLKDPIIKNKPENVDVGNNAFGPEEPTYENPTPEDVGVIFNPDTGTIFAGEGEGAITIPAELEVGGELYPVKEIEKGAYQGSGLISVELPFTLERIEDYAFAGNQLIGIDIPHSVVYVGHYAFAFNEKVHSIDGDIKGTISFIKIYDQEQVHKLNENGDIEENGTKVLSISNTSGKTVELKDYIFVTSANQYVIDDDLVGDNDNPEPEPTPDPEPTPEPEPAPNPEYTESEINNLISQGYVPIATAEELQHIANNSSTPRTFGQGTNFVDQYEGKLDSKFIQVKDIDLISISNFHPIGDKSIEFTGIYDGGNFKINNLSIDGQKVDGQNSSYLGLFGYVSSVRETPSLKNINIINSNIIRGNFYTGILVGKNDSIIENSYSNGSVTGMARTGGLVGDNLGTIRYSNSNTVVSGSDATGGLVGWNDGGLVERSYAVGNVSGDYQQTGGLIGYNLNGGISKDSYSTGNVSTKSTGRTIGGLVGQNSSSYIENSYSTGLVSGTTTLAGGLTGSTYQGNILNSYYNSDTSNQSDTGKGVSRTTSEMQNQANYEGWNFTNIWEITSDNYPTLR